MLYKNIIKNSIYSLISSGFIELSKFIKISFMIGSKLSFFSGVNIIAPMLGVFGGIFRGSFYLLLHSFYKWTLIGGSLIPLIGYHIPHIFASFYWKSSSKLAKIAIPLICMTLFISHPVGFYSIPYASLWMIPIAIAFFNSSNIFLKAFGSTFTAHAIGSTIWIYSVPMTSQAWISLIPIAITERTLFACGMVITYYVFNFIKDLYKQKQFNIKLVKMF